MSTQVVADFQVSRANPSVVGGTGSSVKYFPKAIGASLTSAASTPNANNATGALWLPAGPSTDGRLLHISAVGSYGYDGGDASGTVNIELYGVTGSLTSPTYTVLASTNAQTPLLDTDSWAFSVELYGDNQSGLLGGSYFAYHNGQVISGKGGVSTDNVLTGLGFELPNSSYAYTPPLIRGAVCGFVVGVTFGTSSAFNTATMTQFIIES